MDDIHRCGRPPLDMDVDPAVLAHFLIANPDRKPHEHVRIQEAFAGRFDLIIVSHCCPRPGILFDNWRAFGQKPVVWRTYCQQKAKDEEQATKLRGRGGFYTVRVSPKEAEASWMGKTDAVIRPHVDDHGVPWTGEAGYVLTFQNFYAWRSVVSNTREYERSVRGFPKRLHGHDSVDAPWFTSHLNTVAEQVKAFAECGVYFGLGSKPATLTYNIIEAMMARCPVLTWGQHMGTDTSCPTYEGHLFIDHGTNGFLADSAKEARKWIQYVLMDKERARKVGEAAHKRATEWFGKDRCVAEWKEFIGRIS